MLDLSKVTFVETIDQETGASDFEASLRVWAGVRVSFDEKRPKDTWRFNAIEILRKEIWSHVYREFRCPLLDVRTGIRCRSPFFVSGLGDPVLEIVDELLRKLDYPGIPNEDPKK